MTNPAQKKTSHNQHQDWDWMNMTSSPATNQLVATGWGSEALKSLLLQLLGLFFRQEETTDVGEMIYGNFLEFCPMLKYYMKYSSCGCTRTFLLFVNIDARVYIYRNIYIYIYRIEDLQKQQTKYHILLFESWNSIHMNPNSRLQNWETEGFNSKQ